MSNPTEWIQLYQTGFSNTTTLTETPPITATTTSRTNNDNPNPYHSRSSSSRPIRRRSRASRRKPTTLLNTDITNFRAMVQQFTGGPTAHFPSGPQLPGAGPNFSFTQVARPSGPHVQYPNHAMQQQQQHMSMMMNYNVHAGGGGGVHALPRRSTDDENRSFENYML